HREALFEHGVIVKFGAVVERQRLEVVAVAANGTRRRASHLILVTGGQLLDDRVAGLALHQGKHAMPQVAAHHGIAFPMSRASPCVDFRWPLGNGPFPGQHTPGIVATVALAAELAHDPRMPPQIATRSLVPANAPIDGLVADAQRAAFHERAGDLFRAPLAPDQPRHLGHIRGAETRSATTASTPGDGVAMRFFGAVVAVVAGRIAPQLTRNRTAV